MKRRPRTPPRNLPAASPAPACNRAWATTRLAICSAATSPTTHAIQTRLVSGVEPTKVFRQYPFVPAVEDQWPHGGRSQKVPRATGLLYGHLKVHPRMNATLKQVSSLRKAGDIEMAAR